VFVFEDERDTRFLSGISIFRKRQVLHHQKSSPSPAMKKTMRRTFRARASPSRVRTWT
jgi:hypothetical protein